MRDRLAGQSEGRFDCAKDRYFMSSTGSGRRVGYLVNSEKFEREKDDRWVNYPTSFVFYVFKAQKIQVNSDV
jgi:hypothetical protein